MSLITQKSVLKKLEEVFDPELGISIIDLGLIYKVEIKKNSLKIIMTLTAIGCPLYSLIENDIQEKLKELGSKKIEIELVFEPPWSMDKISKKGKAILGI